jgi:predicted nucleotidyltransferase component of viral defense system
MDLPVLLDFPPPHLRAYARETVIAEKFQALVMLGRANSRMKDLYDIWVLSRTYEFKGDGLARAIAATFARRRTDIPSEPPDALTPAFAEDAAKIQQSNSFVEDVAFQPGSLAEVVRDIRYSGVPHAVCRAARALSGASSA